jgi:6,7-dimethyl-8-ribityllumazine synthase
MKTTQSLRTMRDERFCLVAARFNEGIVDRLVQGAIDTLTSHGVDESRIELVYVPGAFEIPLAVKRIARSERFDGIVALGTVIRGATPHFDYVCEQCADGVSQVCLDFEIPIGFGVLTCDTLEQAVERSGANAGNKGSEAALAAIDMASVLRQIDA